MLSDGFVVRFGHALHNLFFAAKPGEDSLQAGGLFAYFVHGRKQAPKRFNLAIVILLIWHAFTMSAVVKRFTVCFVPKSQEVTTKKNAPYLWKLRPLRISYSHST